MMFTKVRLAIFNWFAAGKMTLNVNKPQEYIPMSTYTLTGNGNSGAVTFNQPSHNLTTPQTGQTMTIKITPANGGTIIQLNTQEYSAGELYIIPDGCDFDRELGKIITVSKLKS